MPSEPRWLSVEHVEELNRLAVELTGEPFHVRDAGLIESAVARPQQHWAYGENRLGHLAGWLLAGIAGNHGFEQGNKRVALLAADAFLAINGWTIEADQDELADLILALSNHELAEKSFITRFARLAYPDEA